MLSWFIHCLKALTNEPEKMLWNKASLYETSQFWQILAIKLNWITLIVKHESSVNWCTDLYVDQRALSVQVSTKRSHMSALQTRPLHKQIGNDLSLMLVACDDIVQFHVRSNAYEYIAASVFRLFYTRYQSAAACHIWPSLSALAQLTHLSKHCHGATSDCTRHSHCCAWEVTLSH